MIEFKKRKTEKEKGKDMEERKGGKNYMVKEKRKDIEERKKKKRVKEKSNDTKEKKEDEARSTG